MLFNSCALKAKFDYIKLARDMVADLLYLSRHVKTDLQVADFQQKKNCRLGCRPPKYSLVDLSAESSKMWSKKVLSKFDLMAFVLPLCVSCDMQEVRAVTWTFSHTG